MNANPFTLGHQYLVETAAASCDLLHLFIVSEDSSLVPFSVRKKLVMEGTAHLSNICYHESGPYIISSATFPSYFQKDETAVIESHARLDPVSYTHLDVYKRQIQLVVRTAEGLAGQETHHIILIQICLADIISIFLIVDVIHTAFAVSASAFGNS